MLGRTLWWPRNHALGIGRQEEKKGCFPKRVCVAFL